MFGLLVKLMKIQLGGEAYISRSEIVDTLINLSDAKKNLTDDQFNKVKALYDEIIHDKTKSKMRLRDYELEKIIMRDNFNTLAPIYLYDGQLNINKK
ncbi:MAG: hypothetical protein H5T96_06945 [Tissierellales bacterium]|nr:hypothetical protein [Tissierellales bacterium]